MKDKFLVCNINLFTKEQNILLIKDNDYFGYLIVDAYILRHYELDDASEYHEILYCQNRLIDYMVYSISKDFNDNYIELLESPQDVMLEENNKEWLFANITILVDYCIIPELDYRYFKKNNKEQL